MIALIVPGVAMRRKLEVGQEIEEDVEDSIFLLELKVIKLINGFLYAENMQADKKAADCFLGP
jgi:hypothetical protein